MVCVCACGQYVWCGVVWNSNARPCVAVGASGVVRRNNRVVSVNVEGLG